MKHASASALDRLEPLLEELRRLPLLKERSRGVFYRKSQAFLHFHEDARGLFGDLRLGSDFERFAVNTPQEYAAFLRLVQARLDP